MAQGLHTPTQTIHTQTQIDFLIVFICFPTTSRPSTHDTQ